MKLFFVFLAIPLHVSAYEGNNTFKPNIFPYNSGLMDVFKENDACLWCLGISQTKVTKEAYTL